jgi:hypothetical protein
VVEDLKNRQAPSTEVSEEAQGKMNSVSPIGAGFRLLFRRLSIPLAEVAWRWSVAAAAWVLGALFVFEYLDTLPVRTLDRLLFYTGQPFLIARAIRRIFAGSSFRFIEAGVLLGLSLVVAWILVASLGRLAIVRSMLNEFEIPLAKGCGAFGSLLFLNFVRAAVTLAAVLGILGSVLMVSSLWASSQMAIADAGRMVFLLWFLVVLAWMVWNWLLSTAAVLAVSEGNAALSAVSSTIGLLQTHSGLMIVAGTLFAVLHIAAFVAAAGAALMLLPAAIAHPVAIVLEIGIAVAYCVFVDFLFTARLGAYVFIVRGAEATASWLQPPPVTPSQPGLARSSVDKDELILSDLPQPAF